MCGEKSWFCRIYEDYKKHVKLGNNTIMEVKLKGDVKFNLKCVVHVMTHVYYVPTLKNNPLSIGHLQEKGLTVQFEGEACKCKVYHSEKGLILKSAMTSN